MAPTRTSPGLKAGSNRPKNQGSRVPPPTPILLVLLCSSLLLFACAVVPASAAAVRCPAYRGSAVANGGGPVLAGGVNLYFVFYGNWMTAGTACAPELLSTLLTSLMMSEGSPNLMSWWKTLTKYCDRKTGQTVSPLFNITQPQFDAYSAGKKLDAKGSSGKKSVWQVVMNNMNYFSFTQTNPDPKGYYIVLASADVKVGGASTSCGWQSFGTVKGKKIPYAVVVEPGKGSSCASPSYNKCPRFDSMANSIVQRIASGITNPFGNAWSQPGTKRGVSDVCNSAKFTKLNGYAAMGGPATFGIKPLYNPATRKCVLQS